MRHAARTDDVQPEIIKALRAIGCRVFYLKEPCDLLVHHRNVLRLFECKDDDGRLTKKQVQLIAEGWPIEIVRSPQEAVNLVLVGSK